ncbi:MAG: hypothetical protein FJZ69_01215 [Bacteroidetes bacterium]|nr:hypothetical protein [Bacteroidota bacterium]
MKKIVNGALFLLVMLFSSCETEMIEPIDPFNLQQGGYMRTVTPFPIPIFTVRVAGMGTTQMEQVLEAVTPNSGANFDSYEMVIRFLDNTPANGNNPKPDAPLRILRSTDFTKDAVTGYPRFRLIVTGSQMLAASGLTIVQVASGDRFEVRAKMKLKDGSVFDASNTSVNITGGAFYSSPFFYRVNVAN